MNWLQIRENIKPICSNFKNYGHSEKFTKQLRNNILSINNYTCRYCGGVYPKYLICVKINTLNINDVCCRACYIITHLNYGLFREIKLYYSLVPQIEIIRKTVDHVINYEELPLPSDIDENILLAPFSILEFINILNNNVEVPPIFNNYKIFFSKKFNIDFIINNYCNKNIMFIDENNDLLTDTDKIPFDDNLTKHELTEEEKKILDNYYNNADFNLNSKMDISIKIATKLIEKQSNIN